MHPKLIWIFLLVALVPAWFINQRLLEIIEPRRSGGRLALYFFICLVLVFAYTFLVVWIIANLFPQAKR